MGILAALLYLILIPIFARPSPPVAVHLMPTFGMAGGGLKVTVVVEPDVKNRILAVAVDADNGAYFRSWQEQLDVPCPAGSPPDKSCAPKTREQLIDTLPAARYTVLATVYRIEGGKVKAVSAAAEACFSGAGVSCASEGEQ